MDRWSFVELESGGEVSFYLSACYCAVSEEQSGDTEVAFMPEDGKAFVDLLEHALASAANGEMGESELQLEHKFANRDGGEKAAFLVRSCAGGLEITISRSDERDQSVCISRSDARTLTDAFIRQLKASDESTPNATSRIAGGPTLDPPIS